MEITPDRLIEVALDNLKRKLTAAVSLHEPLSPAALEKLPGAIREVVDSLHRRGIPIVRGEDILADTQADLTSRLAASLKAGALLPNEITPELVKWLAGTPLAIQIANLIKPSGRRKMAGGGAAMAGTGAIAILAKPPEENGPVSIISKPPGDQSGNNAPIHIIARPPGGQTEPSDPIYIMAKPPSARSSGGSSDAGEPRKRNPRLRWLPPVGLIAVVILFMAGALAVSMGKGYRPAPTPTAGLAIGVNGKTYTVTPSETSVSSPTETPTVEASPTSTDTLTATFSWTDTPTPMAPPAPFFQAIVNPKHVYYRGTGCGENQVRFQVKVAEPAKVTGVWLFVRLMNKDGTEVTGWSGALVMAAAGSGWYSYTLYAEDIPNFTKFREAWVGYQFVAHDGVSEVVTRSEVFHDVELSACGR
jgi:hypothetical protein